MIDIIINDKDNGITDENDDLKKAWGEDFTYLVADNPNLVGIGWEDGAIPFVEDCGFIVDVTDADAIPKEVTFTLRSSVVGRITVYLSSIIWEDKKQIAEFLLADQPNDLEINTK